MAALFDNDREPLTVRRILYKKSSNHDLRTRFFHLFDLLCLDESLLGPPLQKRDAALPLRQKGDARN